jgi:hypothetical protein
VVDLSRFDARGWMTAEANLDYIVEHLWSLPHQPLITLRQIATLRAADQVELRAGALTEYSP